MPEDRTLLNHRCENLKSNVRYFCAISAKPTVHKKGKVVPVLN
jgi:hypothetical protein